MEKVEYIKVLDSGLSQKLIDLGFSYIKEQINNQDVYAFIPDAELIAFLQEQYKTQCFVCENKLRF